MDILNNFYALKDASSAVESTPTVNIQGETLTVQLEGNFTGAAVRMLGCSDLKAEEYHALTGFTSDFKLVSEMTAPGIYTFPIDGMGRFKFSLDAIASGKISVFCRMTTGC